jgi:ribosome-binding factor A
MVSPHLRDIKIAQKEAHLLREISKLLFQLTLDETSLQGIYVTRVKLSPDKSMCTVFFSCSTGKEDFEKKLSTLILYKPSLRSALSKVLSSRYTPDLIFAYDELSEKQKRMEELFHKISSEDKS